MTFVYFYSFSKKPQRFFMCRSGQNSCALCFIMHYQTTITQILYCFVNHNSNISYPKEYYSRIYLRLQLVQMHLYLCTTG